MNVDVGAMERMLQAYRYEQQSILEKTPTLLYNPSCRAMVMKDWYGDGTSTAGSCGELMLRAADDLKQAFPHYHFAKAVGNEPRFFKRDGSTHYFLLVSATPFQFCSSKVRRFSNEEVRTNPLVVDPSFRVVAPLLESGYRVGSVIRPDCKIKPGKTITIVEHDHLPLCFGSTPDAEKTLFYLCIRDKTAPFSFGYQESGKIGVPADSTDLKLQDPRIKKYVAAVRKIRIEKTDRIIKDPTCSDEYTSYH